MLACLVDTDAPYAGRALLGLSLLQRAALAAQDAGATRLWCEPAGVAGLTALIEDGRLRAQRVADVPASGDELLLLRADATCTAAALRALGAAEHLIDAHGVVLAARARPRPGQSPRACLATAPQRGGARAADAACVLDEASLAAARGALLEASGKPSDGPVSRHLNRRVSRAVTRLLLPLGVTPNQVTLLVALIGATAAACAAQPGYAAQLLGGALFQLSSVLDGCDGELARLTHRSSRRGALLDSLVDDASNLGFFAGLSLGVARAHDAAWPLAAAALTLGGYVAVACVQYRAVLRSFGAAGKTAFWAAGDARPGGLTHALHVLGRRDVFALVIALALALGLAPLVVAALPAMALGALARSVARARGMRADASV